MTGECPGNRSVGTNTLRCAERQRSFRFNLGNLVTLTNYKLHVSFYIIYSKIGKFKGLELFGEFSKSHAIGKNYLLIFPQWT